MTLLLFVICLIVAVAALAIHLQPDRFVVTRSALIDAAPEKVFAAINNLRNWDSWSPWANLDPHATASFEGPAAGPGAAFEWSGDKSVGAGRMTIVDSRPTERVDIKLDMRKPFKGSNDISFALAPDGEDVAGSWLARAFRVGRKSPARTHVTWTMSGQADFVSKAVNLAMNCDKMVGGQFEKGLANLNAHLSK
ncbi:SRPBCC family protein [Methylocystis sp. 9N]|uniref:SRPBCC family protein n=1 Tax=Methylocystis borbori TaxID=3118750 RepID=A0ABU7XM91_9HYPH